MFEFLRALTIYRVISLSRLSPDRETSVEITTDEALHCSAPGQSVCPINHAINKNRLEERAASRYSWLMKGAYGQTVPQQLPPGVGKTQSTLVIAGRGFRWQPYYSLWLSAYKIRRV